MPEWKMVRVDVETYAELLAFKHELEEERQGQVSMGEAIAELLRERQ